MPRFDQYIGVRYSGRKDPQDRLRQIRVWMAQEEHPPYMAQNDGDTDEGRWSRRELAEWLQERLQDRSQTTIVGLDHAFSFPESYMLRNNLKSWEDFLADFERNWPTHQVSVRDLIPGNPRTGDPDEHRLTGDWTAFPRAVFNFDLQDSPARSAHAALPWLSYLRRSGAHVWPFDDWEVPEGVSVLAETRPARLRHRYPKDGLASEDQDAYAICAWLQDRDRHDLLVPYFDPPLTPEEKGRAEIEGWILGVA